MRTQFQFRFARLVFTSLWIIAVSSTPLAPSWGYRVVEQIEEAYELSIGELELPDRVSGSVTFRPCDTCSIISLRLQTSSRFRIDGTELDFTEFAAAVLRIQESDDSGNQAIAGVFISMSTGILTRIEVFQLR